MSITKHKIFEIEIEEVDNLSLSENAINAINDFLSEPNYIYVNHSITVLTKDEEHYEQIKTKCKYLVLSLIYKDLNATSLDIKKSSTKVKNVVRKQIEVGEDMEEPNIETEIDREIRVMNVNTGADTDNFEEEGFIEGQPM
ncbi:hypothetical protein [Bernardetia sp. MNP-M8]|uniref:hypothetical protein n=1 Tax=Bernardetia sp. MNP-M8 TaxID=3127470 RepID=UPI0030D19CEC